MILKGLDLCVFLLSNLLNYYEYPLTINYDNFRESYSGCFDQLNSIIGLTFCGEVSVPYEAGRPIYPIYGPVNLAVRIEKEDPSLSAYHIKALYDKNEGI